MIGKLLAGLLIVLAGVTVVGVYEFRYEVLVPSAGIAFAIGYLAIRFFVRKKSQIKWVGLAIIIMFFVAYFTIDEYVEWIGTIMLIFWVSLFANQLRKLKV